MPASLGCCGAHLHGSQTFADLKCPGQLRAPLRLVSCCSRLLWTATACLARAACRACALLGLGGVRACSPMWLYRLPALTVISFCLSASSVTVPSVESVMKVEMGRDCFPRVTAQEHWAPCTRAAWKNGCPPPTQVTVSSATQNLL